MRVELHLAAKINLAHAPETQDERLAVRQLKTALNRLGYYTPDPKQGMHDDIDEGLKDAVYAYQRKSTIFYDDVDLGPRSTTKRILNQDLATIDEDTFYVWRTVGDGKVRGEHAARNGQTFLWSDPPEGGHPSEDYNCRCWAEHKNPPYHPWIEWINERRTQRLGQSATLEKLAPPKGLNTKPLIEAPKLTAEKVASYVAVAAGFIFISRLGRTPIRTILSMLIKNSKPSRNLTGHGSARAIQRKITEGEIVEAIRSAKSAGNVTTKVGKYNTSQIHYKGSNGVTVIIETEGRNAGKVITTYKH